METNNQKKNKKDRIILCVSIVLGIIFWMLFTSVTPLYKATIKGDPTEAEYKLLKEYAVMYTKTLNEDFIKEDDINITSNISEGNLLVTVTQTSRATVKATYPIKFESANSDTVITEIAVNEGTYEESYNRNDNIHRLVIASIISLVLMPIGEYYKIKFIIWVIMQIKNKIKKPKNNDN